MLSIITETPNTLLTLVRFLTSLVMHDWTPHVALTHIGSDYIVLEGETSDQFEDWLRTWGFQELSFPEEEHISSWNRLFAGISVVVHLNDYGYADYLKVYEEVRNTMPFCEAEEMRELAETIHRTGLTVEPIKVTPIPYGMTREEFEQFLNDETDKYNAKVDEHNAKVDEHNHEAAPDHWTLQRNNATGLNPVKVAVMTTKGLLKRMDQNSPEVVKDRLDRILRFLERIQD
jgi:hypothetical protein